MSVQWFWWSKCDKLVVNLKVSTCFNIRYMKANYISQLGLPCSGHLRVIFPIRASERQISHVAKTQDLWELPRRSCCLRLIPFASFCVAIAVSKMWEWWSTTVFLTSSLWLSQISPVSHCCPQVEFWLWPAKQMTSKKLWEEHMRQFQRSALILLAAAAAWQSNR